MRDWITARQGRQRVLIGGSEINMLNFHLSWDWSENLSLGVFGRNLLDDRDLVNASEELGIAFRSRPRTLGFEISADF